MDSEADRSKGTLTALERMGAAQTAQELADVMIAIMNEDPDDCNVFSVLTDNSCVKIPKLGGSIKFLEQLQRNLWLIHEPVCPALIQFHRSAQPNNLP